MTAKENLTADEIETIINFSQKQIGEWPELYTTDKLIMKRYEKFMNKHPTHCRLVKEDKYSMTFSIHPKCVGVYPRAPRKSNLTPEQMRENAKRLRKPEKQNKTPT